VESKYYTVASACKFIENIKIKLGIQILIKYAQKQQEKGANFRIYIACPDSGVNGLQHLETWNLGIIQ
jgi:hypothetical protein